ncbi:MAG: hypothetical protein PSX37_03585 [bacterium]|nr:hypothetical protein [bacterium]
MTELGITDGTVHERRGNTLMLVASAAVGVVIIVASIVIDHRAHVGP